MTTIDSATRPMPASMVGPMPTTVSIVAVDAEPHDDAVQRHRDDDRLEHERDRRGDVEMRRVLDVGLPGDRQRQHDGVQREDVEQRDTGGPGRAA